MTGSASRWRRSARRLALALAILAACARVDGRPLSECLNASRRLFSDASQRRPRSSKRPLRLGAADRPGPPRHVSAFDVLPGDGGECAARVLINRQYAVPKGIQGKASPNVHIDGCAWASALLDIRRLPSVLWNGTAPGPPKRGTLWEAALRAHDLRLHGGSLERMLKAYRVNAQPALAAGIATPAAAAAGRPGSFGSCAVVGGAPSVAESRRGQRIDSHDAVFRFNDHPAGGRFVAMTGRKTTVRILNSMWAGRELPADAAVDRGGHLVQICKRNATFESALRARQRRVLVEPDLLRAFYALFGSGGLTGALGIWLALGWCQQVTLYGFSSPCELGGKYKHYSSALRRTGGYKERVQVNTVKVAIWTHTLRCRRLVRWPPARADGADGCGAGGLGEDNGTLVRG